MKPVSIVMALALVTVCACELRKEQKQPPAETAAQSQPAPEAAPPVPKPSLQPTVTLAAGAPIPVAGVALWLVADDATGAGGKVTAWANSQVSAEVVEAGPDAWPALVPNALNGHAVVRFDGENDMLKTSIDLSPARMPNATVFAVFNTATAETSTLRKLYGDDNGGYDRAVGLDNRGGDPAKNYCVFTGSGGVTSSFAIAPNGFHVSADQFTTTDFSNWIDGSPAIVKAPATWEDSLPNLYIGGTGPVFVEAWKGDLAEMIVYGRTLSDAERVEVVDYLAKKYGLTLKD